MLIGHQVPDPRLAHQPVRVYHPLTGRALCLPQADLSRRLLRYRSRSRRPVNTAACSTPNCPTSSGGYIQPAGSTRMRWLVAAAAGRKGSGTARITFNKAERAAVPSPRSFCALPVVSTNKALASFLCQPGHVGPVARQQPDAPAPPRSVWMGTPADDRASASQ